MHVLRTVLALALAAAVVTPASAHPRDLKLCSSAGLSCECPRQARSCTPLCHLEPLIACPAT